MTVRTLSLWALSALIPSSVAATGADAPGTKDHPLVKRYEGSTIQRSTSKAFDEYVLPLGRSAGRANEVSLPKSVRLEGKVTRITCLAPAGRSTLEVLRNYETELKNQGYKVLFSGADLALGNDAVFPGNFAKAAGYEQIKLPGSAQVTFHNLVTKDQRFLAARLDRPEGSVHVALFATAIADALAPTVSLNPGGTAHEPAEKGRVAFQLDVIESKPMDSGMVTVLAGDMAAGIASSGSIALYGILFDTNSAEVKHGSAPTLQEIAKLLKNQPALRLLVVGHTHNVGTFEANMDLSQRRAASVVKLLASAHGADEKRLTPLGVSFASPVASNKTDAGRAKNRRVQLVER